MTLEEWKKEIEDQAKYGTFAEWSNVNSGKLRALHAAHERLRARTGAGER
jgi:hypothetical protein